ncbi:MAG TPA: class I SAM-dependent methyltransferase [Hyphomicrobiaceae bacterium]|nr:class I SAM-dependent methyltransferase [Hyphomicrobiaceae bacterium]
MSFSPEWLALREPVDHRSRSTKLATRLAARLGARDRIDVVDLGCGAGSNIRATAPLLGRDQRWTLVDYDPRLLAVARERLLAWGRPISESGDTIAIERIDGGIARHLAVTFREADLARDLDRALGERPKLVTAAAFFDLVSAEFIGRLAAAVAARGADFYTTLTFNGVQTWEPRHTADSHMLQSFCRHQHGDKGFGPAAGPDAPAILAKEFAIDGYRISEGDSPWHIGPGDGTLLADLAAGFASAVAERRDVPAAAIAAWRSISRTGAVVGHTDTLATIG